MGKGGGGHTTSTVTQSSLPEYARPFYENLMDRVTEESNRPYQPYQGQRLADQSAATTQGMNMAQNFAQSGSPDLNNARSLNSAVAQGALGYQDYKSGSVNNTYTGPAAWKDATFAADQATTDKFGAAQRDEYMSPYMDSVIASSQREATQNAAIEQAKIKADQGATGAFGGSRGAVQQQIAANAAQNRISDIGVQGRQAAFENAQQQFERDQGRGLQAQLANQKANLEALGMGEQSRQYGYGMGESGRQKAAELGMQAQSETEKWRQGGAQLGLQGLQLAGQSAGQLADFQKLSDQMMMDRFKAQLGVGEMGENRQQKALDLNYQDFLNQINHPRQNLSFFSSMLASQPTGTNQTTTNNQPTNPLAGIAGMGLSANALYNLGRG